MIIDTPVTRRCDVRCPIKDVTDLADDARINDGIDGFAIVLGKPMVPSQAGSVRIGKVARCVHVQDPLKGFTTLS
jgi:hypothetical protein